MTTTPAIIRPAACSEEDASTYLGMSVHTLKKARYRGALPAIVFNGRKVTYLYTDLDAYLAKHRSAAGKPAKGRCAVWAARRAPRPSAPASQSHPTAPATGETANA